MADWVTRRLTPGGIMGERGNQGIERVVLTTCPGRFAGNNLQDIASRARVCVRIGGPVPAVPVTVGCCPAGPTAAPREVLGVQVPASVNPPAKTACARFLHVCSSFQTERADEQATSVKSEWLARVAGWAQRREFSGRNLFWNWRLTYRPRFLQFARGAP